MKGIDSTTSPEEILDDIKSNLVAVQQIRTPEHVSTPDLLHAISATRGIIVLTSVTDVQVLPEIRRRMVGDLRAAAVRDRCFARDLVKKRRSETALGCFLRQRSEVTGER
jgi:hypothetical protein